MTEKEEYKGYTIEIWSDEAPLNPRKDYDNLWTLICFHKRYSLGDTHAFKHTDYNSWAALKAAILKEYGKDALIHSLWMYDHGNQSFHIDGYSGPDAQWDAGQIGFAVARRKDVRDCYGVQRVTKAVVERADKCLKAEVDTYEAWCNGWCYGYTIIHDPEGNETELSVGGYIGMDHEESGLLGSARQDIDAMVEKKVA